MADLALYLVSVDERGAQGLEEVCHGGRGNRYVAEGLRTGDIIGRILASDNMPASAHHWPCSSP